jgi:hypothetical protein
MAPEMCGLLQEIVGGRNGNTAPVLAALRKHAPKLLKEIRATLARAVQS